MTKICKKCGSPNLNVEYEGKRGIDTLLYKCQTCGYIWHEDPIVKGMVKGETEDVGTK